MPNYTATSLASCRTSAGLTQKKMAEAVGYPYPYYCAAERGKVEVSKELYVAAQRVVRATQQAGAPASKAPLSELSVTIRTRGMELTDAHPPLIFVYIRLFKEECKDWPMRKRREYRDGHGHTYAVWWTRTKNIIIEVRNSNE